MSDLSPEARALVDAARAEAPPAGARAAIKSNVLAKVGPGTAASASVSAGVGIKGLVATLSLGLVAGALYVGAPDPSPPETPAAPVAALAPVEEAVDIASPAVETAPAAEVAAAPELTAKPTPEPAPALPARKVRRRAKSTPPAPPAPEVRPVAPEPEPATDVLRLAEEARLLKVVRRALRDRDFRKVLAATAAHAARFPEGALVIERLAARAQALCMTGALDEGRNVRAALAARAPSSPSLAVVDDACAD